MGQIIHVAYFNTYHQHDVQKCSSSLFSNDGNHFLFLFIFPQSGNIFAHLPIHFNDESAQLFVMVLSSLFKSCTIYRVYRSCWRT